MAAREERSIARVWAKVAATSERIGRVLGGAFRKLFPLLSIASLLLRRFGCLVGLKAALGPLCGIPVCHEGGLYLSVEFLNQPIGLRMVGRCSNPLRAKYRDEICKERRLKLFSSVCRYRGGYTEYGHLTFHECLRNCFGCHVS